MIFIVTKHPVPGLEGSSTMFPFVLNNSPAAPSTTGSDVIVKQFPCLSYCWVSDTLRTSVPVRRMLISLTLKKIPFVEEAPTFCTTISLESGSSRDRHSCEKNYKRKIRACLPMNLLTRPGAFKGALKQTVLFPSAVQLEIAASGSSFTTLW